MFLHDTKKRKEIAEAVYNRYCQPLTREEKKDLENEVGAGYLGYEAAMKEIHNMISEEKTTEEIKTYIESIIKNI